MAIYPCDVHNQRYTGPADHVYAAFYSGRECERQRYRVCPECSLELRADGDSQLFAATDEGLSGAFPDQCASCSSSLDVSRLLFYLTIFSGTERWDYFQAYCEPCVRGRQSSTLAAKLWRLGEPRRAFHAIVYPAALPPLDDRK